VGTDIFLDKTVSKLNCEIPYVLSFTVASSDFSLK
jgi:hypothetical protein